MVKKTRLRRLGDMQITPPNSPSYGLGDETPASGTCGPVIPRATVQLCMKRTGKSGPLLKDAAGACSFVHSMEEAAQENFLALHLDVRHRVIGVDHVGKGSLTGVEVHPRDVFKAAILNNAAAVIFVHNHPSGETDPSRQDMELTGRLKNAGEMLGIHVLDHIVVGAEAPCYSFSDKGLMGPWAPPERGKRKT